MEFRLKTGIFDSSKIIASNDGRVYDFPKFEFFSFMIQFHISDESSIKLRHFEK